MRSDTMLLVSLLVANIAAASMAAYTLGKIKGLW